MSLTQFDDLMASASTPLVDAKADDLAKSNEALETLKKQKTTLAQQVEELLQTSREQESQLEALEEIAVHNTELARENATLRVEHSESTQEARALKEQLSLHQREAAENDITHKKLVAEKNDFQMKAMKLEEQNKRLKEELAQANNKMLSSLVSGSGVSSQSESFYQRKMQVQDGYTLFMSGQHPFALCSNRTLRLPSSRRQ
jgi:chromosome segregation ATPase